MTEQLQDTMKQLGEKAEDLFNEFWGATLQTDAEGNAHPEPSVKIGDWRVPVAGIMAELADYHQLMENATAVFYEVTDGRVSKCHTVPKDVLAAVAAAEFDRWDRAADRLVDDYVTNLMSPVDELVERYDVDRDTPGFRMVAKDILSARIDVAPDLPVPSLEHVKAALKRRHRIEGEY